MRTNNNNLVDFLNKQTNIRGFWKFSTGGKRQT